MNLNPKNIITGNWNYNIKMYLKITKKKILFYLFLSVKKETKGLKYSYIYPVLVLTVFLNRIIFNSYKCLKYLLSLTFS